MTENDLIDAIRAQSRPLDYPVGSLVLPRFKWGNPYGTSDAIIFPRTGQTKIAIVEAKLTEGLAGAPGNAEAHAHVVGQLLKYYAAALRMHRGGLDVLREAAFRKGAAEATSPRRLLGVPEQEAWVQLSDGPEVQPRAVALHLIVNRVTSAFEPRMRPIRHVLQRHHGLTIRVWLVGEGGPSELWPDDYSSADHE